MKFLGPTNVLVAHIYQKIAELMLWRPHRLRSSKSFAQKALAIFEEKVSPSHMFMASCKNTLGLILEQTALGKHDETQQTLLHQAENLHISAGTFIS